MTKSKIGQIAKTHSANLFNKKRQISKPKSQ
jgi:hypothetical protein